MKCVYCDEEATVFGEYGPTCGNCYFTLKDFEQRGKKLSEMTMEELQRLERIYTLYATAYAQKLQEIKNEIEARRLNER
jgi:hypothetical protein